MIFVIFGGGMSINKPLQDDFYKTLLESTKAIPWRIDWESGLFEYIGPQIQELLGWAPETWKSVHEWRDRIHQDDREKTFSYCLRQSEAGVDHEADYRALAADGSYVWIRDVVHVIRENGKTKALVGFMFDISERKKMETMVHQLNHQLEQLSYTDPLTNIANRRRYDETIRAEWSRGIRHESPISLVILDVDHFKSYNDHYGHVMGDECLQRIARALTRVTGRSSDLLARFGGEEFVLMLPDTDLSSAALIAQRCIDEIKKLKIPHIKSTVSSKHVSISAGVASCIPKTDGDPNKLLDSADKMLYQAKQTGRNKISYSEIKEIAV
ncbi:sensor domain-containing diguanylate cyclase [Sessilibacter sp. MAH4]